MVPVEPSPNWSECLVGFLVDVPNQPPKRFYMTWLHHSPPLRQGENLMFFFFRMSLLPKRSSWASEGTQDPEVRAEGGWQCQGRPSSANLKVFCVFLSPRISGDYLSQKSPYFWRVESRSLWHAFDHIWVKRMGPRRTLCILYIYIYYMTIYIVACQVPSL